MRALAIGLLGVVACSLAPPAPSGAEGQRCAPDGTCDEGLACVDDTCVVNDDSGCTGDACECTPTFEPSGADYDIAPLSGVTIDGDLGEWADVPAVSIAATGRGAADNTMEVMLAWDAMYLYAAFTVSDSEVIAAQTLRDAGDLYLDDVVELYVDSLDDGGTAMRTDDFQVLVSATNVVADLRGTGSGKDPLWNAEVVSASTIAGSANDGGGDSGYIIELAVPWSAIGVVAADGDALGINLAFGDADTASGYTAEDWAGQDGAFATPAGYRSATLVVPSCAPTGDACEGVTCSGHGTCVVAGDDASCDCDAGYEAVGLSCVGDDLPNVVTVTLVAEGGASGSQRVNLALPLSPGHLSDATQLRVLAGGSELAAARRGLAQYGDGSWRSVQIQVEVDIDDTSSLEVRVNEAPTTTALTLMTVTDTLATVDEDGQSFALPRVWAVLPAGWLSASGVFGYLAPHAAITQAPLDAWARICDYEAWDTAALFDDGAASQRGPWLYDRGTIFYRGYAMRGDLATLRTAYKEANLYFARIALAGDSATLTLPEGGGDQGMYMYTQNLAYHYLLTGDDRYRAAAEGMATRAETSFDPEYEVEGFWTERYAGFTLLANVFAAVVSSDRRAELMSNAATRVDAYLAMQDAYTESAANDAADARCFAHDKVAAREDDPYPAYMICSPWMSAILADGLEAYAREVDAAEAARARQAIVKLGRRLAQADNRDDDGRPHYILGVDGAGVEDGYDEHWGESAYVVALAYHLGGRTETALRDAALDYAQGFDDRGLAGHVRSFNWQCRSAVATPYLLDE